MLGVPAFGARASLARPPLPFSFEDDDHVRKADIKCVGEADEIGEARVTFASLDAADVSAVQSRASGQRLLGERSFLAQLADRGAEREVQIAATGHPATLAACRL